jgi:ATP-binding cassette subfamily B protein
MATPEEEARHRPKGRSLRPLAELLPYLRPYRGMLALSIAALLVASGLMLALPVAGRYVIDHGFASGDGAIVNRYFFYFGALIVVFCAFASARYYLLSWVGERVVADVRDAVYSHVIRMDPTFFEVTRTGEVLSRLTADTTLIQSIAGVGFSLVLRSLLQLPGAPGHAGRDQHQAHGVIVLLIPAVIVPSSSSAGASVAYPASRPHSGYQRDGQRIAQCGADHPGVHRRAILSRRFHDAVEASFDTAIAHEVRR